PLEIFQVAILLFHDWLPLGRLTDLPAVRRVHGNRALALATLAGALPAILGLTFTLTFLSHGWPHWYRTYLIYAYGFLFIGELQAWWLPYLLWPQPKRAAEYSVMFG